MATSSATIDIRSTGTPNEPWLCPAGQFANKYLLVVLEEAQGPVMGRKYSHEYVLSEPDVRNKKDGRPISPHPIARARVYTCGQHGENRVEVSPPDLDAAGIIMLCTVTLFPFNQPYDAGTAQLAEGATLLPSPILSGRFDPALATENTYPPDTMHVFPRRPLGDKLANLRNYTHGARDVQHVIVPDPDRLGRQAMYFVFKDLMIAEVGHFVLKYKVIFIDPAFLSEIPPPALGICWGRVFAIFPSKKAPNLKSSTALEKHLHKNGGHVSHPRDVSPVNRPASGRPKSKKAATTVAHAVPAAHLPAIRAAPLAIRTRQLDDEDDEDDEMDELVDETQVLSSHHQTQEQDRGRSGQASTSATTRSIPLWQPTSAMQRNSVLASPPLGPSSPSGTTGSSAASLPPSSPGSFSDHSGAGSPRPQWGSPPGHGLSFANASSATLAPASPTVVPVQRARRYDPVRDL